MSAHSEENAALRSILHDTRQHVQMTRNQYWRASLSGNVGDELHMEIGARVLQYHDVLYEFRNLPALEEGDFPDISEVRQCIGETETQITEAAGRGRGNTMSDEPRILSVPIDRLIWYTEELDDLAQKIGFGPNASAQKTDVLDKQQVHSAFKNGAHDE